jgi:hypothetical protein
MPRPELLSPAQREALMAPPSDLNECIRYYTLSANDLHLINQHRGIHNQLGFAVQLCYLRFPGRALAVEEVPPPEIVGFVAAQLNLPPSAWSEYAKRDQTRREHLQQLQRHSGLRLLTVADYRSVAAWVTALAMQTSKGIVLVEGAVEEMRRRRLLLPPIRVIERMCAEAATRARRRIYRTLTGPLTEQQRHDLDALLEATPSGKASKLAWLRQPAGAPSPHNLLGLIERLNVIREIKLPAQMGQAVHQNRLLQLAREGAQSDAPHLRQLEPMRRHATLVVILLETAATLTDEILDMHDRMIGSLFARAKRVYETSFQESGKAINEKIRLYVKVGQALISAKAEGRDPFQAIEQIVPWQKFTQSVSEAEKLARPEDLDYLDLVGEGYARVRRYAPTFLAAFEFCAAPVAKSLNEAINLLRQLNVINSRRVPNDAPRAFVRQRWSRYVFTDDGIDRRYYELCVLAELKNALRSGDMWLNSNKGTKCDIESRARRGCSLGIQLCNLQFLSALAPSLTASFALRPGDRSESS